MEKLKIGTLADRHAERLDLYYQGKTDREIAEELGFGPCTILLWRQKNNLPAHGKTKYEALLKERYELYLQGKTYVSITFF